MLGCLYDPRWTEIGTEVSQGRLMASEIREIPCETPLPAGAVCLCDCVEANRAYETGDTVCACDTVTVPAIAKSEGFTCVCDTISVGAKEPPPPPTRRNKSSCSDGGDSRPKRPKSGHYWKPN